MSIFKNPRQLLIIFILCFATLLPAKAHACAWWDLGCHARRTAAWVAEQARRVAEAARRAAEWVAEQARRAAAAIKAAIEAAARLAALLLQGKIEQFIQEIKKILKTFLPPAFGAPKGPATGDVFRFANGCYAVRVINPTERFRDQVFGGRLIASIASFFGIKIFQEKYLIPAPLGLTYAAWADRGGAEPIYMKAAGLGHYFFMDRQSRYWDAGFLLTRKEGLYNSLIWRLVDVGDGNYKMYSPAMDVWLFQHVTGHMGATKFPNFSPTIRFDPASGCAEYPELPTDAHGTPRKDPWPDGSVFGMADTHIHLFAADSFGQQVMAGKTYSPLGVRRALGDSASTHGDGAWRDALWLVDEQVNDAHEHPGRYMGIAPAKDGTRLNAGQLALNILTLARLKNPIGSAVWKVKDTSGYPDFASWPRYDSITNTQTYYKWLERAYLGGLRLVNVPLVNNNVICELVDSIAVFGEFPLRESRECDDGPNIKYQLDRMKTMERYIDAQNGGPGKGWFKIVYSAREARDVVQSGKMAAIIGVEGSNLFECTRLAEARCTYDFIGRKLDEYHSWGIRTLFMVHKFDNAFGSPNYNEGSFINAGNQFNNTVPFDLEECTFAGDFKPRIYKSSGLPGNGAVVDVLLNIVFKLLTPLHLEPRLLNIGRIDKVKEYPPTPVKDSSTGGETKSHCIKSGLTAKGEFLQKEMMRRGMILEGDHLSPKGYDQFAALAKKYDYPFMHGHAMAFQQRNSYDTFRDSIALGGGPAPLGMLTLMTDSYDYDKTNPVKKIIALKQELKAFPGIAYGSDINGVPILPTRACTAGDCVSYPFQSFGGGHVRFERMRYGNKVADYNRDPGPPTVGQLPDHVQALLNTGKLSYSDVENLHKGAEWFLKMWEKSERRAKCIDSNCPPEAPQVYHSVASVPVESDRPNTITLRNVHANKVLDVEGVSKTDGARVWLWDSWGGDNQKWRHMPDGTLRAAHSNKCLDAAAWGTSNGTQVVQWECHGGVNQQWRLLPSGMIQGVQSGRCLDAAGWGTANGTPLLLWDCHGGNNQKWHSQQHTSVH